MASFLDSLHATLLEAAEGLPGVASRQMFGCQALFRGSQIFALVWKDGRLGLRLPDAGAYAELAGAPGTIPWTIAKPGGKRVTMGHWLLVPEEWNDGDDALAAWARRAHALAGAAPVKKPAPRTAAKKR